MTKFQTTRRITALVLALVLVLTGIPTGALAVDQTTIPGAAQTIGVASSTDDSRSRSFNSGWKFYLGDNTSASNPTFNDSDWENISLPHDFSIIQSYTTSGEAESGFLPGGTGWYRKTFTLPASDAGKTVLLNFDGVYSDAYVYVNGTYVGEHHYGYTAFAFDITDYLTCDGSAENVIAVKAVNNIPTSRWYSGSGIYRDVTLIVADPVHVDLNGTTVTTPNIAGGDGTVNVAVDVVNDGSESATVQVTSTVYPKGSDEAVASHTATVTVEAGATAAAATTPVVTSPKLWSVDEPNLYTVTTELTVDGAVVDSYESEFGFRWFSFDANGFHLNGENVKLNGVCLHHDQGGLGSAAYYDAMYRQLSIMKDMGCNAIRTAHNPADEDFIAICNELGLLVIEEAFDGLLDPKNGNSNDFSLYFDETIGSGNGLYGAESSMTWAEYAARSMVKRDRNAPAIIAWSIGNEIQEGTYWTQTSDFDDVAANVITWFNDEDGTRPATIGDNNRGGDSRVIDVLNVITSNGGIAGFNYANTAGELYSLAQSYGGSTGCIIATETASHTNSRGIYASQASNSSADGKYHLTSYDTSAVSWGITAHDSIYNTYQYDCVAGEFVWTGFDYLGEPTPWNGTGSGSVSYSGAYPNSSYFGIVETTGFEKDTYYLYRSQWNKDETTLHLVTAWDADNMMTTNGMTPVWVYSNAPVVKLYRNGTLVGTATRVAHTSAAGHTCYTYTTVSNDSAVCTTASGTGADGLYAVFNVAYEAGTLNAKAYEADGVTEITLAGNCGKHTVTTPGTVSQLQVSANKTEMNADGSGLVYITVDVTDAAGNLDTTATNTIYFSLTGNGEIVAVDNGDQATTAKYQQSSVRTSSTSAQIAAYAGKALVIVRSTEDAGSITVSVTSSGLTGGSVTIKTVEQEAQTEGLTSYTMVKDYTVKVGTRPQFETTAAGNLADGSSVTGTIVWEEVPAAVYGTAGDYTVNGVLTFDGYAEIAVSCKLHVIDDVIALRNVSTVTTPGVVPTLPATVSGVLADGTLSGEFTVTWDAVSADALANAGDVVVVSGTAAIFGTETLAVTASIRVAEAVNTESANVAPSASSLTQDIEESKQSDRLESIRNGVLKPGDNTSERWTNWNNRTTSAQATLTFQWATAQLISSVNLYYYYDSCCAYPEAVEFAYSLDGSTFYTVGSTAELVESYSLGAQYTYTFDQVVNPVALRIIFTQQNGTSGSNCVGITEAEIMTFAGQLEVNAAADLSAIYVDGVALGDFSADTTAYTAEGTTVTAKSEVNAAITILPAVDHVVKILTLSEDGTTAKTYTVTLTEAVSCDHANTQVINAAEADCDHDGYTGDTWCDDCETVIAAGEIIPALGHDYSVKGETVEPTCTEGGYTVYTCSRCDAHEHRDFTEAVGHSTVLVNAAEADCEHDGYTGDHYCTVCETTVRTGTVIPATGHAWGQGVETKAPTETETGIMTYTCGTCGATYTEEIPVLTTEKTAPTVSVSAAVNTSTGRIVITGKFSDYENAETYYDVTAHGIVYMLKNRLGTRNLTVNTSGRTRVNFSAYKEDGSYVYNLKPTGGNSYYVIRAFLAYTDPDTGKTIYVYSDPITVSYNSLK